MIYRRRATMDSKVRVFVDFILGKLRERRETRKGAE